MDPVEEAKRLVTEVLHVVDDLQLSNEDQLEAAEHIRGFLADKLSEWRAAHKAAPTDAPAPGLPSLDVEHVCCCQRRA